MPRLLPPIDSSLHHQAEAPPAEEQQQQEDQAELELLLAALSQAPLKPAAAGALIIQVSKIQMLVDVAEGSGALGQLLEATAAGSGRACAAAAAPVTLRDLAVANLVRLTDCPDATLLLKAASLLLRLLPAGSPQAQRTARALCQLSKSGANDSRFRLGGALRPMLQCIDAHISSCCTTSTSSDSDVGTSSAAAAGCRAAGEEDRSARARQIDHGSCRTLLYLAAAAKNISSAPANQGALARAGAIGCLGRLVFSMCCGGDHHQQQSQQQVEISGDKQESSRDLRLQVAVQATAALRNLALDPAHASLFCQGGCSCLAALAGCMYTNPGESELALNVSRVLGKLSCCAQCCEALEATPVAGGGGGSFLLLLLQLAWRHRAGAPVLVRLVFALGNATSASASARAALGDSDAACDALLRLLQETADALLSAKAAAAAAAAGLEDACTKLLRLLANVAMHRAAGRRLAGLPGTAAALADLLGGCSFEQSGELVLNAAAAISNLAYLIDDGSPADAAPTPHFHNQVRFLPSRCAYLHASTP
jgi:hypothetical protein